MDRGFPKSPFRVEILTHCLKGQIGGKLIVLSSSLPSVGAGALKDREDPKIFGTSKVCPCFLSLAVQDDSYWPYLGINSPLPCFVILQIIRYRLLKGAYIR